MQKRYLHSTWNYSGISLDSFAALCLAGKPAFDVISNGDERKVRHVVG